MGRRRRTAGASSWSGCASSSATSPPSTGSTSRIEPGEFFSLLGPSGCGKTTTLRMIAGFERPTGGQILLDGRDLVDTPPHRRPVNTVFQSYALFPHMCVEDNVAYGLRWRRGVDKADRAPAGRARRSSSCASAASNTGGRRSCRAGSSSASPSPGPSCWRRRCCSSTSRSAPSTPSCASTSRPISPRSSARSGSRSSTSPTTRRRR